MQRNHALATAVLAVAALGPPVAANADASGAGEAVFPPGAGLAGVALDGFEFGFGVTTGEAGGAAGNFQATLFSNQVEIVVESAITAVSVDASGVVTLSGEATLDAAPARVPFTATLASDSVALVVGSTELPVAGLTAGAIQLD